MEWNGYGVIWKSASCVKGSLDHDDDFVMQVDLEVKKIGVAGGG